MSMTNGLPEESKGPMLGRDALINNLAAAKESAYTENFLAAKENTASADEAEAKVVERQQRLENEPTQEAIAKAGHIAVATTGELVTNPNDYWDEAPNLPNQDRTSWREAHGLDVSEAVVVESVEPEEASKIVEPIAEGYMSPAPQLPVQK